MTGRLWRVICAVTAVAVLASCSTDDPPASAGLPTAMPSSGTSTVEFAGRPVTVHVPRSYDPARPAPLVIALHGYSSYAQEVETYLRLTPESERTGFLYAYPDGSTDDQGNRFWNATDACCAFTGARPDDSRHLSELITAIAGAYRVDRARVYLIGHSNGGFMAFRMACDHAGQVTAIVTLNAAGWNDPAQCRPSAPVSVLAVHSSADETISYNGGANAGVAYPSASATVDQWLGFNKCSRDGLDAPALDLVTGLPGAETTVRAYTEGCEGRSTVQAWTIEGGSHVPSLGSAFAPAVTGFLLSQVRPTS